MSCSARGRPESMNSKLARIASLSDTSRSSSLSADHQRYDVVWEKPRTHFGGSSGLVLRTATVQFRCYRVSGFGLRICSGFWIELRLGRSRQRVSRKEPRPATSAESKALQQQTRTSQHNVLPPNPQPKASNSSKALTPFH